MSKGEFGRICADYADAAARCVYLGCRLRDGSGAYGEYGEYGEFGMMDASVGSGKGKTKIALIFGGQSLEHEVSLWSARSVLAGLDMGRFDVVLAGIDKNGGWHIFDCPRQRVADGELEASLAIAGGAIGGGGREAGHGGKSADGREASDGGKNAVGREDGHEREAGHGGKSADGHEAGYGGSAGASAAMAVAEASASAVASAQTGGVRLERRRRDADMCGGATIQALAEEGVDVFFPIMHGRLGEDGSIQGLLEMAGAAYVGCGVFASAACMDKSMAKIILASAGIPQARYVLCNARDIAGLSGGHLQSGKRGGAGNLAAGMESRADGGHVAACPAENAACATENAACAAGDIAGAENATGAAENSDAVAGNAGGIVEEIERRLGYPCFVKPSSSGSSVGVSKCASRAALIEALWLAAKYDSKILVEEFVEGREFECAVLGNDSPQASVVGEIIPGAEFYDYSAKYIDGTSESAIPADLPASASERVRELAVRAFSAMGCSGLARVDFFIRESDGSVVLNEINTMPGFTEISMYPKLWEASGLPYPKLLERLAELALERKRVGGRLAKTLDGAPL